MDPDRPGNGGTDAFMLLTSWYFWPVCGVSQ
jgi:hypothetical protein